MWYNDYKYCKYNIISGVSFINFEIFYYFFQGRKLLLYYSRQIFLFKFFKIKKDDIFSLEKY